MGTKPSSWIRWGRWLRPLDMHVQYNHSLPQVVQQSLNNSLVLVVAVKQRMKVRRWYGTSCSRAARMSCLEKLGNLYGEQLDTKIEQQLLSDMLRLWPALVAQNNLVNIVRLRSQTQDRDEPIRSYLARLKNGAALQCASWPCRVRLHNSSQVRSSQARLSQDRKIQGRSRLEIF